MSRKNKRMACFSPAAYDRIMEFSMPSQPFGYGYENSSRMETHPSKLFFTKNKNGVILNKLPCETKLVRSLTILELDNEGYYSPIRVPSSWKVFYFHDLPQLLEVEAEYDGYPEYFFFRYDQKKEEFIEVVYDSFNLRFVDRKE